MSKRGDKTKDLILRTSKTLFAEKGFTALTMKDVCEATGLSRGGLYEHYGSTAEIFKAMFFALSEPQTDVIDDAICSGQSAISILDNLFSTFNKEMQEPEESLSLAIYEYAENCDKLFLQSMHEKSVDRWMRLLDYGIARNEFAPVDKEAFIALLLYAYQGIRIFSRFVTDTQAPSRVLVFLRGQLIPEHPYEV